MSSQDEDGGGHPYGGGINHFEPIPHDHDFCERVVINVSIYDLMKITIFSGLIQIQDSRVDEQKKLIFKDCRVKFFTF